MRACALRKYYGVKIRKSFEAAYRKKRRRIKRQCKHVPWESIVGQELKTLQLHKERSEEELRGNANMCQGEVLRDRQATRTRKQ